MPAGWAALSWFGLGVEGRNVLTLPRIRVWLGVVGTELLFDQADSAGIIQTTWC